MARKQLRDNFGRWQKTAVVHITKRLEKIANDMEVDILEDVAEKLESTYKDNVLASYTPRSAEGYQNMLYNARKRAEEAEDRAIGIENPRRSRKKVTYHHTGKFLESIKVVVEDRAAKVKIEELVYDDGKADGKSATTLKVYDWLTKGTNTKIGHNYAYKTKNGISGGRNYPTEIHNFELWTKLEMKAFMEGLENDIKNGQYVNKKNLK